MGIRRTMATTAVAALIAGGFTVAAIPAQAGTASITGSITESSIDISASYPWQDCTFNTWGVPLQAGMRTFTVTEAGTYSFTGTSTPSGTTYMNISHDSYSVANCVAAGVDSFSANLEPGQTYVMTIWLCHQCSTNFLGDYSIDASGPGDINVDSTAGGDAYLPIPAWVQSYGRGSTEEICKSGWNPSWELWPHDGTGGWVCTREIPSLG